MKTQQELIDWHLRPVRQREIHPYTVITHTPIDLYDQVADIGCGPGYFTLPLAKYLLYGKVYALDTRDEMLDALRLEVNEARLSNVEIAKCGATKFPLPKESLDGAFLSLVIQETRNRTVFLKAVRDLIRPMGWCAILEWCEPDSPDESIIAPPVEDPICTKDMETLVRSVGFKLEFIRILSGGYYMAQMRR